MLLERLASGQVSLSVVALLKHHLTDGNCAGLLAAVSGKTVGQAREALAAWFPQPDAPLSIRKLPSRRPVADDAGPQRSETAADRFASARAGGVDMRPAASAPAPAGVSNAEAPTAPRTVEPPAAPPAPNALPTPLPPRSRGPAASSPIAPLSPERFKITFTADADLKRKLDHARDLLRHAIPQGDLATLLGRALDLLIERTERRRFATTGKPATKSASTPGSRESTARANAAPARCRPAGGVAHHLENEPDVADPAQTLTTTPSGPPAPPAPAPHHSHHIPNEVRRAVIQRDGQRCTWVGPDGHRCESRAWLELDHIIPRGIGGTDDPANIRIICRSHNRLAAEQVYGQPAITRIIARRRAHASPPESGPR